MSKRQNVVIVGGGGAGTPAARHLSATLDPSKYKLILINTRPYFAHLVAAIRMVVTAEGKLEDEVLIPFDKTFVNGSGELVVGEVTSITDQGEQGGYVTLSSGETIDYSILILTPGSTWEGLLHLPDTKVETQTWVDSWRGKFEKSDDILLVGGGAVAIEYAGEIKDIWPEKKVTIIHSQKLLLNDAYPEKWRLDVERRVRARGVEVILGDVVQGDFTEHTGSITTRNGKNLTPDLIVPTRGARPNTSFIGASLGEDKLTPAGFVKILPTFQLPAHPRIFAAGDIADWPEQKQVGKYYSHAEIVAQNVMDVLNGVKPSKLYKGSHEMIVITIGKNGGAAFFNVLWGIMLGNWVSSTLKSKDLLVGMTRKRLGQTD